MDQAGIDGDDVVRVFGIQSQDISLNRELYFMAVVPFLCGGDTFCNFPIQMGNALEGITDLLSFQDQLLWVRAVHDLTSTASGKDGAWGGSS